MKPKTLITIVVSLLAAVASFGQNLSTLPSFALGHPPESLARAPTTSQPNLVEGAELRSPRSVAVDLTTGAIYVSDLGNNRVLAWADARTFTSGARADLVVGQSNFTSTGSGGPGTGRQSGLSAPVGIAVDSAGNLYVVDGGNNRLVVFPRPFENDTGVARQVIGQPTLLTKGRNQGGLSASSIATASGSSVFHCSLTFDAEGNLWFTDAGNHRVLRYPAAKIGPDAAHGPAADLVLGQSTFTTNSGLSQNVNNRTKLDGLREPSGIALDDGGRVYVVDALSRCLVYTPGLFSGKPASRVMGLGAAPAPGETPQPVTEYTLGALSASILRPAEGVFTIGNIPFVIDTWLNRILRYAPYEEWPAATPQAPSPPAVSVIGQDGMRGDRTIVNRGGVEPGAGSMNLPISAAAGFGLVFVADSNNNRVLVFPDLIDGNSSTVAQRVLGQSDFAFRGPNRLEGREFFLTPFPTFDLTDLNNINPVSGGGIAIDRKAAKPHLYVADTNNHRILAFADVRRVRNGDTADLVIGQVGLFRALANSPKNDQLQIGPAGLFLPTDVTLDEEGNVWVADQGNSRVVRFAKPFTEDGSVIPGPYEANLVLGQFDLQSRTTDATARTMAAPFGLEFTSEGGLLVSDSVHHRILFFEKPFENGKAASKVIGQSDFNSFGSGSGGAKFNVPLGISVDVSDRLYVADSINNRIMVFGDIRFTGNGPLAVLSLSGLSRPRDVYVSETTGKAWVADTNHNRILLYPRFDDLTLPGGAVAEAALASGGPLALEEDPFGSLIVGDAFNRVVGYFPALTPTNAASYIPRLTPGMITSLFYQQTPAIQPTEFTTVPLPRELSDIQVLVDGEPMPLFFVGPTQINFLMSNNAPETGSVEIVVLRPSTQQIIATNLVQVDIASPGMFASNFRGFGQIAALNEDNSVNSASNPIKPGKVIQMFGTGAGHIPGAPPDGEPATGITWTPVLPWIYVNSRWLNEFDPTLIKYSGLAPTLVGVWQVNFEVPDYVPDSDSVLVVVKMKDRVGSDPGMATTIAVKR